MNIQQVLFDEWQCAWFNGMMNNIGCHPRDLSANKNITMSLILNNLDCEWNWRSLSTNLNIPILDKLKHPDLPWHWDWLCYSSHLTEKMILDHPNYPWRYDKLPFNNNISIKFILEHSHKPWVLVGKCTDVNITTDVILQYYKIINFNWFFLSKNPNVTMNFVANHPELPWDYSGLSYNENVTEEFVLNNLNKSWNFDQLLYRNCFSIVFVSDCYKRFRSPTHIGWHSFEIYKTRHLEQQTKQILIMSIYEKYFDIEPDCQLAKIEYVLADEYLAKLISLF